MSGDGAGRRQPDPVVVFCDHLQRAAQVPQPKRLSDDEGMQRNSVHQRLRFALFQHLLEIVDDGIGKCLRCAVMDADHRNVIDLVRIGHRKQTATAGSDPHRLIVHRPVENICVPGLLQQIGRARRRIDARAEPTLRRLPFMSRDRIRHVADHQAPTRDAFQRGECRRRNKAQAVDHHQHREHDQEARQLPPRKEAMVGWSWG